VGLGDGCLESRAPRIRHAPADIYSLPYLLWPLHQVRPIREPAVSSPRRGMRWFQNDLRVRPLRCPRHLADGVERAVNLRAVHQRLRVDHTIGAPDFRNIRATARWSAVLPGRGRSAAESQSRQLHDGRRRLRAPAFGAAPAGWRKRRPSLVAAATVIVGLMFAAEHAGAAPKAGRSARRPSCNCRLLTFCGAGSSAARSTADIVPSPDVRNQGRQCVINSAAADELLVRDSPPVRLHHEMPRAS